MFAQIAVAMVVGIVGLVYKSLKPPPPKICGSPGGPPVTTPRFKLRDGRHMAYKLVGVQLEIAKHKVVVCHGFHDSKEMSFPYSQELLEELSVCFVVYDRPGYGESDPNPKRSPKNEALDIDELADHLKLGSRFYVIALSVGAYVGWSCLMYIPHRLSGISLVSPFFNYYWPGFPSKLVNKCFKRLPIQDQWSIRIAHYAPWLFYWFMTQKLIPAFKTGVNEDIFVKEDLDIFKKFSDNPNFAALEAKAKQQGEFYCLYQDLLTGYGKWEQGPLDVKNPFPNNDGLVHLWQAGEDKVIPIELTRYIAEKQPWIKYHELTGRGHMFFHYPDLCEGFLREILSG